MRVLADGWQDAASRLSLRHEQAADEAFLAALYADARAEEMRPVAWPEAAKRDFLQQQYELQREHYRQHYVGADFLLIEQAAIPIGRISIYRTDGEIRLMDIALIESHRGLGIGSILLAELLREASASAAELTLHVEPNNPAQRLYARLGFRLIEDRGVYHFLGWRAADAGDV